MAVPSPSSIFCGSSRLAVVILVALLAAFPTRPAVAQDQAWIQDAWTVEDGLPQNSVNDLAVDAQGFLWIATYDGLARFDGSRFTVFRSANAPGLPSNRVTTLSVAQDSTLWIGTESGVAAYRNGEFTTLSVEDGLPNRFINTLATTPEGAIWISTEGRRDDDLVSFHAGTWTSITNQEGQSPDAEYMLVDTRSSVWSTGRYGVWHLPTLRFQPLVDGVSDAVKGIFERSDGAVIVATENGRLYAPDVAGTHTLWTHVDDIQEGRAFVSDGKTGVWIGAKGTVHHFDGERTTNRIPLEGRESAMVMSLLPMPDGSVWVGTNGQGLVRLKPAMIDVIGRSRGLDPEVALSITEATDGTVWVGTNCGGVFRIRRGNAQRVNTPLIPENACVYSVLAHSNGDVWTGHRELVRFRNGAFTSFDQRHGLAENPSLRSAFIIALYEDPLDANVLWVGTQNGFHRFEDGRFETVVPSNELLHPHVRGFMRDPEGRLWIATRGGVHVLDGKTSHTLTMDDGLPSNDVRSFHPGSDGSIWIGTYGGGLANWNDGVIRTVSERDGLFENVISSMTESNGMLWTSGNRGIARTPVDSLNAFLEGRARNVRGIGYQQEAGLSNPETNGGFQPSAWPARDGRIWYPTLAGAAVVDPDAIHREGRAPVVHVTDVQLREGQRNFEIQYTGIDLSAPERLTYRYRLLPFDDDWQDVGTRPEAIYTNVPPGTYRFEVQAANREGLWGRKASAGPIVIPHEWYELRVVRVVGLALLIVGILGYLRQRSFQAKRRETKLNELVTSRTKDLQSALATISDQAEQLKRLDHAKSRFFQDTSHEFRTPLTLILGPLQKLMDTSTGRSLPDTVRRDLATVQQNAQRLLDLINQLLRLARFDAGAMVMEPEWMDLVPVVRARVGMFRSLASSKEVELTFRHDPARMMYPVDVGALETILFQVLSNAVTQTPPGGRVDVYLRQQPDGAVGLDVADSGPGFSPAALHQLFERNEGGGESQFGLAITKEFLDLHGGTIEATNQPEGGALVRIAFPPVRAHPEKNPAYAPLPVDVDDFDSGSPLILVIDDHDDIREYVSESLNEGTVMEAARALDGLELAREHVPDAIISDVMMPGMDGIEFCRQIRSDTRTSHIPVILLTARADAESRMEGLSAGADDYLDKPFRAKELNARLSSLLRTRERIRNHLKAELSLTEGAPPAVEAETSSVRESESSFVRSVRDIIAANVENPQFGVDALADELSLSRRQLSRKLGALTDLSPGVMIRETRLRHAAELLKSDDLTIQDVATRVGYNSASHFSQAFQAHFGYAPSDVPDR